MTEHEHWMELIQTRRWKTSRSFNNINQIINNNNK